MFSKKNTKRGFTLIEMLIVIVIIGILAAALIPRLSSARGRANDVARKADLAQVAAALVAFQIDRGNFPTTGGSLDKIKDALMSAGMSSIPEDPNTSRWFDGIAGGTTGQYSYTPITKGIPNNGFVVMAGSETEGGSNRISTGNNISSTTDYGNIKICKSFTKGSTASNDGNGNCVYTNLNQLRYIYLY